jgi:hypothetical protein
MSVRMSFLESLKFAMLVGVGVGVGFATFMRFSSKNH